MSCYCRITGKARGLPKQNHFFPLLPPISPKDAKKLKCKITSNFNSKHSYVPIFKSLKGAHVRCHVTHDSEVILIEHRHKYVPVSLSGSKVRVKPGKCVNHSSSGVASGDYLHLNGSCDVNSKNDRNVSATGSGDRLGTKQGVVMTDDTKIVIPSNGHDHQTEFGHEAQHVNSDDSGVGSSMALPIVRTENVPKSYAYVVINSKSLSSEECPIDLIDKLNSTTKLCDPQDSFAKTHFLYILEDQKVLLLLDNVLEMAIYSGLVQDMKISKNDGFLEIKMEGADYELKAAGCATKQIDSWTKQGLVLYGGGPGPEAQLMLEAAEKKAQEAKSGTAGKKKNKKPQKKNNKGDITKSVVGLFEEKDRLEEESEREAESRIEPDIEKVGLVVNKIQEQVALSQDKGDKMEGDMVGVNVIVNDTESALKSAEEVEHAGGDVDKDLPALGLEVPSSVLTKKRKSIVGMAMTHPSDLLVPLEGKSGYLLVNDEDKVEFVEQETFNPGEEGSGNVKAIPGQWIESESKFIPGKTVSLKNGQMKFIPGQVLEATLEESEASEPCQQFVPGEMVKTKQGQTKFVPGQYIEVNGTRKFVPGKVMKVENDELRFVPGQVIDVFNEQIFIPGQIIETDSEGMKFVPGQVMEINGEMRFLPGEVVYEEGKIRFKPGELVQLDDGEFHFLAKDLSVGTDGQVGFSLQGWTVENEELELIHGSQANPESISPIPHSSLDGTERCSYSPLHVETENGLNPAISGPLTPTDLRAIFSYTNAPPQGTEGSSDRFRIDGKLLRLLSDLGVACGGGDDELSSSVIPSVEISIDVSPADFEDDDNTSICDMTTEKGGQSSSSASQLSTLPPRGEKGSKPTPLKRSVSVNTFNLFQQVLEDMKNSGEQPEVCTKSNIENNTMLLKAIGEVMDEIPVGDPALVKSKIMEKVQSELQYSVKSPMKTDMTTSSVPKAKKPVMTSLHEKPEVAVLQEQIVHLHESVPMGRADSAVMDMLVSSDDVKVLSHVVEKMSGNCNVKLTQVIHDVIQESTEEYARKIISDISDEGAVLLKEAIELAQVMGISDDLIHELELLLVPGAENDSDTRVLEDETVLDILRHLYLIKSHQLHDSKRRAKVIQMCYERKLMGSSASSPEVPKEQVIGYMIDDLFSRIDNMNVDMNDPNDPNGCNCVIIVKNGLTTIIPRGAAHRILTGEIGYMLVDDAGIKVYQAVGKRKRKPPPKSANQATTLC